MSSQDKDKNEQALEKKSAAEIEKAVMFDNMPFKAIKIFKDKGIYLTVPMHVTYLDKCDKILFLKAALRNSDLHEEIINEIMGDLITGAYQNRLEAYEISLSKDSRESLDVISKLQRQRQSADMHLLNIIKAIKDIKRPPVQVIVKQAEQVNVGEQINQGDQPVNIAKNQQSA